MKSSKTLSYVCTELYYALTPHRLWLLVLLVSLAGLISLNALHGELKSWAELDWVDIVGEGATALLIIAWLVIILSARAKGAVTDLFATGLILVALAFSQDLLDEFFQLNAAVRWDSWVESIPVGFLLLTAALWFWRAEQQQMNRYLSRRQLLSTAPETINGRLNIPSLDYLQQQLKQRAKQSNHWAKQQLLLLELSNFNQLSRQHGAAETERLLLSMTELLLLALPTNALLCHYAGQRFAILLDGSISQHPGLKQQLQALLQQFCFYSQHQGDIITPQFNWVGVTAKPAETPQQAVQQLIEQASLQLTVLKHAHQGEALAN